MSDIQNEIVVVEDLSEVDESQCNKWFHCPDCDWDFQDPYAEIFNDDRLIGKCECGWSGWKSLRTAFEGQTRKEKNQAENQQLTEFAQ